MEVDVDADVEIVLYSLYWLAALTPDVSMLPPDDIFAETAHHFFRDQQWDYATDPLSEPASTPLLEGIEKVFGRGR
ncbi:MAG TPA: hypothetical protein VKV40_19555 [Ktedonobacteraceae bacterium]|nr:hypothetical protein [Ktedonobacteraceae bacterium]